jgi:DNA polymerase-4
LQQVLLSLLFWRLRMALRALFLDFNSYFASVEQQLQPHLRDRPVAVVPVMVDSTCCIAASYEAKRYGVRTGTPVWQARQLCPGLQLVEARPGVYVAFHHRLVEVVESCVHVTQVLSIDEMTCELSGALGSRERSEKLARHIKAKLAEEIGAYLRCSIGIAPNTFLAKTATELQKPDGLVVIEEGDLPHCLHSLQLRDLCGIGSRMHRRLRSYGIYSVQELCEARRETLRLVWRGIEGERMYQNLRGETVYRPPSRRISLGHSHILPPEERTPQGAYAVLSRLLQKAAMRLRKMQLVARGLEVFVRHVKGATWSAHTAFAETDDTLIFVQAMSFLWQRRPNEYSIPLGVGVTLFALKPAALCTRSLFDEDQAHQKLNCAVDDLNERFGSTAVYLGGAHHALHSAPERIAFNHIPETGKDEPAHFTRKTPLATPQQTNFATSHTVSRDGKRLPCSRLFD